MAHTHFFKAFLFFVCLAAAAAFAAEIDVNGGFAGTGKPDGWNQNKPNMWDPEGKLTMTKVEDIGKTSVKLTSKTRKMHLYNKTAIPVQKGDAIEIRGLVKGQGKGVFGAYMYPMGWASTKGFNATDEWTEFVAKVDITTEKVKEVRVLVGVEPQGDVEFMNITVDKKEAAEKK